MVPEVAGNAVQHRAQPRRVQRAVDGVGATGSLRQRTRAVDIEGMDAVAHRLLVAAEIAGDVRDSSPSALARTIWQRRRVKASDERRPASTAQRSASVSGRPQIGAFMQTRVRHTLTSSLMPHCAACGVHTAQLTWRPTRATNARSCSRSNGLAR